MFGDTKPNKSVEVNERGGVCQSFHTVSFLSGAAGWRCPPVPHLLRSQDNSRHPPSWLVIVLGQSTIANWSILFPVHFVAMPFDRSITKIAKNANKTLDGSGFSH